MKLGEEHVAQWNARLAEDWAEGDETAHVEVLAAWTMDWLARCSDRSCIHKHHFSVVACCVRRYDHPWPVPCVGLREDGAEVVFDMTKPQLAAYIADLTALFQSLP